MLTCESWLVVSRAGRRPSFGKQRAEVIGLGVRAANVFYSGVFCFVDEVEACSLLVGVQSFYQW